MLVFFGCNNSHFHIQDIHALILGKAITGIPAFAN